MRSNFLFSSGPIFWLLQWEQRERSWGGRMTRKVFLKKNSSILKWALFCLQGNLKNESNQQHKVNKVTKIFENWIWLLFVCSSIWFIFLRASFSSCTPWRGMWTVPPWETCYKPWPLNSQRMNNQDWYFNSGKQTALNIKYTWIYIFCFWWWIIQEMTQYFF